MVTAMVLIRWTSIAMGLVHRRSPTWPTSAMWGWWNSFSAGTIRVECLNFVKRESCREWQLIVSWWTQLDFLPISANQWRLPPQEPEREEEVQIEEPPEDQGGWNPFVTVTADDPLVLGGEGTSALANATLLACALGVGSAAISNAVRHHLLVGLLIYDPWMLDVAWQVSMFESEPTTKPWDALGTSSQTVVW